VNGKTNGDEIMMVLRNNLLEISFPEIHKEARCSISFQRTLRIPDDNREYPLPAGLGTFPLFHVDDYARQVPKTWIPHGGIFMPMYQSEAMWINFDSEYDYPFAVKIAAGKINAITGNEWKDELSGTPQDYAVLPEQPWLDGFCIRKGLIRQFVSMPLGEGFTAEGQIIGNEEQGGLQLIVYPMKRDYYDRMVAGVSNAHLVSCSYSSEMGLAPGGLMRQEIFEDDHGLDAWDTSVSSRCFVHLVNSRSYQSMTGCRPPTEPMTVAQYENSGIPWFNYWDDENAALQGSKILARLDSVAAKKIKEDKEVDEPIVKIENQDVVELRPDRVREGRF
jgi:hypothetical protein